MACELRIPDLVASGPRTADELAAECGADPGAMLRVLRALASLEVLAQTSDGRFEATPLSEQFRQDVPGLGPYARFVTGPESWRAWGELLEAVRTGRTAFELVYGMGLFDYGREHPERGRIFNQAMTSSKERYRRRMLRGGESVKEKSWMTRSKLNHGSGLAPCLVPCPRDGYRPIQR